MNDTVIPVLNAASVNLVAQTKAAYQNVGFAYVENVDVAPELTERVFQMSKAFHAQPLAVKNRIALNSLHRGFIAIDTSTDRNSQLARVTKPNQSESFMMMREAAEDDVDVLQAAYLAGPNQWPELPGFRETLLEYDAAMTKVARRFMGVFAECLNTDPAEFSRHFVRPTTWLRLLHYPGLPGNAPENTYGSPPENTYGSPPDDLYGSAPHCDFGFITLLAQAEVSGLQVQHPDDGWIDVPPRPGAYVLNTGNMLHRWSNGKLRSTPHRVINRNEQSRYSCAFFFDPNVRTTVQPLEACMEKDETARFGAIRFDDYLRQELEAAYDQHSE